jgi:hypothetical protein
VTILPYARQANQRCNSWGIDQHAVSEVCRFDDCLIRKLRDYHCHKLILIQPEQRKPCKTDRRGAAALSELVWVPWTMAQTASWRADRALSFRAQARGATARWPRCWRCASALTYFSHSSSPSL